MKTRKFLTYFLGAVLLAGAASCSDDLEYTPAELPDNAQVYFPNSQPAAVTLEADQSSVSVTVSRKVTTDALTVPVALKGGEGLFTAPANVSFAAGAAQAALPVTFDRSKLTDGASYNLTFEIGDATVTTPYGASSFALTLSVPEPYVLLGKGLYREDMMGPLYGGDVLEYEVEIYENTNNPGYIYLKNAYGAPYPYNEPGDYVTDDMYLAINVKDPAKVIIPKQYIGCNWGDGDMYIGTLAPGTYEKGIITFPTKGLLIGFANFEAGSGYYANTNGMFRVVMPGVVLSDYSVEAAYDGFRVGADNTARPVVKLACGADVASVNYAFVEGFQRDWSETLAGIVDGSVESLSAEVSGETELVCETELEAGVYTMVIVPVSAAGEMQAEDAVGISFYFAGASAVETPEVQVATGLFPFTAVFGTGYKYDDSNALAWIIQGQEIKSLKTAFVKTSALDAILDKGATIEQVAEANCKELDAEYLFDLDENGVTADAYTGLTPEESYTFIVLAENIYGNTVVKAASRATAAAPAAEAAARLSRGELKAPAASATALAAL